MTEVFNEQLVKREPTTGDLVKKVSYVVIAMGVIFISMLSSLLFFFIALILLVEFVALKFLFTRLNVEYEYIMTNSELDIDKIIDKRKRKHLFSFNVKSIIAMAKYDEMDKSTEFKKFDKRVNVSSGIIKPETYVFVTIENKQRLLVVMEPNEHILKSMKIYMANKIL